MRRPRASPPRLALLALLASPCAAQDRCTDVRVSWTEEGTALGLLLPLRTISQELEPAFEYKQLACAALLAAADVSHGVDDVVPTLSQMVAPAFQVTPVVFDSEYRTRPSLEAFNEVYSQGIRAVIGGAKSFLSEPLSQLGSVYGIPLVSYWASSQSLSNKDLYNYFARTYQSDEYTVKALLSLMSARGSGTPNFNWHNIAVLHTRDTYGINYASGLERSALDFSVAVQKSIAFDSFTVDGDLAFSLEVEERVAELKATGVNIFVLVCHENECLEVMKQAYGMDMTSDGYVWILADAVSIEQVNTMIKIFPDEADNIPLYFSGLLNFISSPEPTAGYDRFVKRWHAASQSDCTNREFNVSTTPPLFSVDPYSQGAFLYDAVVAISIALKTAASPLNNGTGSEGGKAIFSHLLNVSFEGASGDVLFDSNGDRVGDTLTFVLDNWLFNTTSRTMYKQMATSIRSFVAQSELAEGVIFPGGSSTPPSDRFQMQLPGMWTSLMDPLAFLPLMIFVLTTVVMVALTSPQEGVYKPGLMTSFTICFATIETCSDWALFIRCMTDLKYRAPYDSRREVIAVLLYFMIASQVIRLSVGTLLTGFIMRTSRKQYLQGKGMQVLEVASALTQPSAAPPTVLLNGASPRSNDGDSIHSRLALKWKEMSARKWTYSLLLFLTPTNSTLLRMLPWHDRIYGGYPHAGLLLIELMHFPLATFPQIIFTGIYLYYAPDSERLIPGLCLCVSLGSLLYRGLNPFVVITRIRRVKKAVERNEREMREVRVASIEQRLAKTAPTGYRPEQGIALPKALVSSPSVVRPPGMFSRDT